MIHSIFYPNQRCNAQTKSSPSKYVQVLGILTKDQREIIKDLGFGELLKFKLTYQSIYIIEFLLNSTDPKSLVTCMGGKDRSLPIHQNAVHCVLGVPIGRGDDLPHYEDENLELNNLKSELGLTKDSRITYEMLLKKIEKGGTDDLTIRCFFLVLFSSLLFPGTQLFITGCQAAMTRSIDELKTINWAKVVVDGIRAAVNKWHTRGSTEKRSSICCCATFMMLYYLDHLNYVNALPLDRTPRAAFYDTKLVKEIIKSDEGPNHAFGKLNLEGIATGDDVQFMSQLEGIVEGLDENIRNNEEVKELVAEARRAYSKVVEAYLEHKKSIDASFLSSLNNLVKEFKAAADNLVEKHTAAVDAPPAKAADSSVEKPTAAADAPPAKAADISVEKPTADASPGHDVSMFTEKELSLYDLVKKILKFEGFTNFMLFINEAIKNNFTNYFLKTLTRSVSGLQFSMIGKINFSF
ncbi:hypothetical protein ACJX0J_018842 [Zea mays]